MNTYLEEGRFANSAMQFHIGSRNFYGKNSRMPIATFRSVIIVQAKAEQNFIFRNRVNTKTNYGSKLGVTDGFAFKLPDHLGENGFKKLQILYKKIFKVESI